MTVQLEFRLNGEVPVRLFTIKARKFFGLAVLLFFTIPFGLSVTGCGHKAATVVYCNGHNTGPVVGELASIQLEPSLAIVGESLNYGQIGTSLSASGFDCKGSAVSLSHVTYGTSNATIADVNPSTGSACGGTWNRTTSGGVPDFTTCNPPTTTPSDYLAFITASSNGITSNALPVYVHPSASAVNFGQGNCSTDPDTTCCPTDPTTVITNAPAYNGTSCLSQGKIGQIAARVVSSTGPVTYTVIGATVTSTGTTIAVSGPSAPPAQRVVTLSGFTGSLGGLNSQTYVVSSNLPNQVLADPLGMGHAYSTFTLANTFGITPVVVNITLVPVVPATTPTTYTFPTFGASSTTSNITCNAGHITWGTEGAANIVSIDQNGVVTANQPGSVAITGHLSNSSSANSIGFFSTCPPISITLQAVGQTGTNITVPLHNTQPITAFAYDKNNTQLTGLNFEYNSTTPTTIPGGSTVQPIFPGTAEITAVCQPSVCNPAPYSQIGYLGNGKPLTSNPLTITATGTSSTLLYIASTNSQYVLPVDFTNGINVAPIKLPYVPNSMQLSQDGSRLYFGSPQGLMTVATANNSVGNTNTLIPGTVISISPAGETAVVTDPLRQTISLVTGSGASVATTFNGVATHASWSPDAQTVYITTTGNNILTYSQYTNWQPTLVSQGSSNTTYKDVAVLQPSVGAYFAGNVNVDGRSYCPLSQNVGGGSPPTENNTFTPFAGASAGNIDRIATTTDDKHVLGASVATGVTDIFLTATPSDCTTVNSGTERSAITFAGASRTVAFAGIIPNLITGVLPSSNSAIAFVTYTGTGGKLPYYLPVATGNTGTLNYFPLTGGAIAPVAGVFSSDDSTFFVGTSGDNKVHLLTITYPTTGAPVIVDSSQITPALLDSTGVTTAVPNLIAQHPKATKN